MLPTTLVCLELPYLISIPPLSRFGDIGSCSLEALPSKLSQCFTPRRTYWRCVRLDKNGSDFFSGSRNSPFSVSNSIPRNVIVSAGPSVLLSAIGTPNLLHQSIANCRAWLHCGAPGTPNSMKLSGIGHIPPEYDLKVYSLGRTDFCLHRPGRR